ncbi:MAG: cation:proton antiporter [Candidatus Omnitrophota bacterium]|nr:cation:proton antiporter [Candidatus Omnitrophota bacterium]
MDWFIFDISVLVVCAAAFSYLAILTKQPIIVAYIFCGILFGPWLLAWVKDIDFITAVSRLGITLLLFLAGIVLHPRHLAKLFRRTSIVTLGGSAVSFLLVFAYASLFNFSFVENIYIALALMFSSTILAVKLLPTTKLHHGKIGAICIGILIAQDLLAIMVLVLMRGFTNGAFTYLNIGLLVLKFIFLAAMAFLFEQFILRKVLAQVDRFHETIFIISLAWCFGMAWLSNRLGLSFEIGAFLAGVALARHPISLFVSEQLKPLRDFFLVMFFFVLGAKINLSILPKIFLPALILTILFMLAKPLLFMRLFRFSREDPVLAREASVRLGQASEFSLLIALLAFELKHISLYASQFIELVTILSMIISSYIVVFSYPTPVGVREKLIQD